MRVRDHIFGMEDIYNIKPLEQSQNNSMERVYLFLGMLLLMHELNFVECVKKPFSNIDVYFSDQTIERNDDGATKPPLISRRSPVVDDKIPSLPFRPPPLPRFMSLKIEKGTHYRVLLQRPSAPNALRPDRPDLSPCNLC